jgi:putative sigma-54 modulation protein
MNIELRTVNAGMADILRGYVERRLRFALGRFGDRVSQVVVTLSRNGGTQSTCRITTHMQPFGRVAVKESGLDLLAAIDRAAGRVGRLFGRELARLREARTTRESVRLSA